MVSVNKPSSLANNHKYTTDPVLRLSGVRCPEVVDVPPPTAPTPPDDVREESPFGRPRAANGKGAAAAPAAAAEKPKGKAIAPKDFFAAAATGGGLGGGKGKGKPKGDEEKPAAKKGGGGIGSFFRKGEIRNLMWLWMGRGRGAMIAIGVVFWEVHCFVAGGAVLLSVCGRN